MKNKTPLFITAILILLSLFISEECKAQRGTDSPTTSGCSRLAVSPISSIPPLFTDMSFNTMIGYVWMDSVCRHLSQNGLDVYLSSFNSYDTLRYLYKYLYATTDYDPILLKEYSVAAPSLDTSFHLSPSAVIKAVLDKGEKILGRTHKYNFIENASYILDITVDQIVSDVDDSAKGFAPAPLPIKCIKATINDIIKGQRHPFCQESHELSTYYTDCLSISYSPLWMKYDIGMYEVDSSDIDSLLKPCKNCYGNELFSVGKRYVVFLNDNFLDYNGTSSYYILRPLNGFENYGGVYKVVDGSVSDSDNYWGLGSSTTLADFKTELRSIISSIVH